MKAPTKLERKSLWHVEGSGFMYADVVASTAAEAIMLGSWAMYVIYSDRTAPELRDTESTWEPTLVKEKYPLVYVEVPDA